MCMFNSQECHCKFSETGVAQRQSVYNIVGRILRPCIKVRKTDGYRLISGRSQDRNLSPVSFTSCALKKRTRGRLFPHQTPINRCSAEEARLKTSSVNAIRPCIKVRKTDGYRITSRRSQDRNLSPVSFTSCALQKRTRGRLPPSCTNHFHGGR